MKKLTLLLCFIVLSAVALVACGGSDEEVKSGKTLVTYVDDYKKSLGIETNMETKDGKNSLRINENIYLFVDVDDKDKVTASYIAAEFQALGTKELEEAQKALIHSYNEDLSENEIYGVMKDLEIDSTTDKKTNVESIDGAQLTYSVDSSSILKAEYK